MEFVNTTTLPHAIFIKKMIFWPAKNHSKFLAQEETFQAQQYKNALGSQMIKYHFNCMKSLARWF